MFVLGGSRVCLIAAMAAACVGGEVATAADAVPDGDRAGVQVLTRGPVHEAFAETVTFDPQPGIVVPKAPPGPIEELPPEQRPAGTNVAWIPGYWAWDDEGQDFLWVSGIWRALPPGREWVSGYWVPVEKGAQWTSGYWSDAARAEAEYLPEPPESVEAGPNVAAPSADSLWLPGCWVRQQDRYVWRPGLWSTAQPNWVWIPAHFQWTPRGYVQVSGYWDHEVDRRGMLFAPVSFDRNVSSQQGFSYTPSTVIDLGVFASHLFLRPNYGHYYYGDYYGANYATVGFLPWFAFNSGRQGYDPIYAQQRWSHRQDGDWERRVQSDFRHRRENETARPPRTFAAQQVLERNGPQARDAGRAFALPLAKYTQATAGPVRFQPVSDDDRRRLAQTAQEGRAHREERQKLEARVAAPIAGQPPQAAAPTRIKLPRSPFAAQPADGPRTGPEPPKTHALPPPDPKVVAKPRPAIGQAQPPKVQPQPNPVAPPNVKPQPAPQPVPPPKVQPQPAPQPKPVAPPNVKPQPAPQPAPPPKTQPQPAAQPKPVAPPKVEKEPAPPQGVPGEKPKGKPEEKPKGKPSRS